MRCLIRNKATLSRVADLVGEPIEFATTRGGTDHRIDAYLPDGRIIYVYRDGTTEPSNIRWEPRKPRHARPA
jgi:hypothetical protein